MDLFERYRQARMEKESPLANRMRPRTLDEFFGQEHILAPGRLLRRAIEADQLSSLIFYGPPGTGKTTLAMVIANTTRSHFITINAVLTGVAKLRAAVKEAVERRDAREQRTTLFVDEVHRWNKAQQDALLPHVEKGTIILIGATTENPYFEVNKALVSRSRIFQLKPLGKQDLKRVAEAALGDAQRGYGDRRVHVEAEALDHLVNVANGDARSVLNALELAVETTAPAADGVVVVDLAVAEESIQQRAVLYDKEGDVHYDTISAFIKSLRGSDPDAALYWMAKMVYAGEDPRFIFRRMAILASEDVGLADPQAAVVVASLWQIFERVGMPEGRFALSQAALYLATCPKSNTTMAFFDALAAVRRERETDVPNHLKDPSRDKEGFGHGKGYLYPHAYRDHWTAQQYLPDGLQGRVFYEPSRQGYEGQLGGQVEKRREAQLAAALEGDTAWPEVLTTSPADRSKQDWLQRAGSGKSERLEKLREHLFALAAPQRHHLLLDAHAVSGLLTWEGLRRVPEGGVWTLTADAAKAEVILHQAQRLAPLDRPHVMVGVLTELQALLARAGDGAVQFDRVLWRDPVTGRKATPALPTAAELAQIERCLRPTGILVAAQPVARRGQRLHALVDWPQDLEKLSAQVAAIEERIFHASDDPLVCWDIEDLTDCFETAAWGAVTVERQTIPTERRIRPELLETWFSSHRPAEKRPSYGLQLKHAGLSPKEIDRVAALYRKQLSDRHVTWHTVVAFIVVRKDG
jgi:putative ATPase